MSAASVNTSLEVIGVVKRGRPSSFTQDIADEICERLAEGESLLSICRDDHMPKRHTVNDWCVRDPQFFGQYMRARELQADHESDDIRDIADNVRILPDRAKLMIDTRKWRAERMNTRRWGAQVQHQHVVTERPKELGDKDLDGGLGFLAQALLPK